MEFVLDSGSQCDIHGTVFLKLKQYLQLWANPNQMLPLLHGIRNNRTWVNYNLTFQTMKTLSSKFAFSSNKEDRFTDPDSDLEYRYLSCCIHWLFEDGKSEWIISTNAYEIGFKGYVNWMVSDFLTRSSLLSSATRMILIVYFICHKKI